MFLLHVLFWREEPLRVLLAVWLVTLHEDLEQTNIEVLECCRYYI